jgi:hypothetical protein
LLWQKTWTQKAKGNNTREKPAENAAVPRTNNYYKMESYKANIAFSGNFFM